MRTDLFAIMFKSNTNKYEIESFIPQWINGLIMKKAFLLYVMKDLY